MRGPSRFDGQTEGNIRLSQFCQGLVHTCLAFPWICEIGDRDDYVSPIGSMARRLGGGSSMGAYYR